MLNLSELNFTFTQKPLLIGGLAMELYGLRKSGADIDLVVCQDDIARLVKQFPNNVKNLSGDLGVVVAGFEIWRTIQYFDYDFLKVGANENENFLLISLEKLLFLKALVMQQQKYYRDLELLVEKIQNDQSKKAEYVRATNDKLLHG